LYQGMSRIGFELAVAPIQVEVKADAFEVHAIYPQDLGVIIRGRIVDSDTIQVDEVLTRNAPMFRLHITLTDYARDPDFGWIARRSRTRLNDEDTLYTIATLSKVPKSAIERFAATPDPVRSDAIRGELKLHTMNETRAAGHRVSQFQDGTWVDTTGPTPVANSRSSTRVWGWVLATGLVVALVVTRVRQARAVS
jgi:hypothetical protein